MDGGENKNKNKNKKQKKKKKKEKKKEKRFQGEATQKEHISLLQKSVGIQEETHRIVTGSKACHRIVTAEQSSVWFQIRKRPPGPLTSL